MTLLRISNILGWSGFSILLGFMVYAVFEAIKMFIEAQRRKKRHRTAIGGMILPANPENPSNKYIQKFICKLFGHQDKQFDCPATPQYVNMPDGPPAMQYHLFTQCQRCERVVETGMELRSISGGPYERMQTFGG